MKQMDVVKKGDLVRIVWRDAVDGDASYSLQKLGKIGIRNATTAIISTTGRFLKTANGYVILADVLHEESEGKLFYEKRGSGKWMSIPGGNIVKITPVTGKEKNLSSQVKRRRIIFKHLRFIPRARRLQSGEITRTLYLR
jgi:hypothetical protein